MKIITLIAVGCMTFWVADDANAQRGKKRQQDSGAERQIDDENGKLGQRSRRGRRGQRGQINGGEQGENAGPQRDRSQMLESIYNRFDADKNGLISVAEAPERMQQRFESIDANGDMSISKEELIASFGNRRGAQQAENGNSRKGKSRDADGMRKRGGQKGGRGRRQGSQGQRNKMDVSKLIELVDTNKDGVISKEEAPDRMKQRFEQLDADSSGSITTEEMKAAFDKMKQRGGKRGARGRNKTDGIGGKSPQKPKRPPMTEGGF